MSIRSNDKAAEQRDHDHDERGGTLQFLQSARRISCSSSQVSDNRRPDAESGPATKGSQRQRQSPPPKPQYVSSYSQKNLLLADLPSSAALRAMFRTDCFASRQRQRGWRRGRDSNPRWRLSQSGFQDRRDRPLCHLSAKMVDGSGLVDRRSADRQRFSHPIIHDPPIHAALTGTAGGT